MLVTNYHVVGNSTEVLVLFPAEEDGKIVAEKKFYINNAQKLAITGRVIRKEKKHDLALIELERLPDDTPALNLAAECCSPR